MSPTPRTRSATTANPRPAEGIDDLTGSVRILARNSRELLADAGEVLEREIAMAVQTSERLRDATVSEELLREARGVRVQAGLRRSAHGVVDLVADAVGVATVSAVRFGEAMIDQPRRTVEDGSQDVAAAAGA